MRPVISITEQGNGTSGTIISEDPALRGPITETVREEVIPRGISAFQNRAAKCPASRRGDEAGGRKTRSLTNEALTRHLHNGETVPREWILYSLSTGDICCVACKVLPTHSSASVVGFSELLELDFEDLICDFAKKKTRN